MLVEQCPTFSSLLSIVFVGDQELLILVALVVAEHILKSYVCFLHLREVDFRAYKVVSAGSSLLRCIVVARSLGCFEVNLPFTCPCCGHCSESTE